LGNKDNQFARLLLDWAPAEKLKVSVNLNGWENNSDRQAPADSALALLNPPLASFVPLTVNEPIAPHDSRAADWPGGFPPKNDESFYQGSLRGDYEVSDALTLTYLGTYEHFNAADVETGMATQTVYYAIQTAGISSTFHELRASGKVLDNKLDWLIGANYSEDKDNESLLDHTIGATTAYVLAGLPGGGPIDFIDPAMTQDTTTKSVFGNLEYHLLDNLSVHGGVRYTESAIEHTGCMRAEDPVTAQTFTAFEALLRGGVGVIPVGAGDCATIDPATVLPTLTVNSLDQHNVPWRVGVDWSPIEKTLLYVTASRGYKAGSFPNIGAVSTKALSPASQESVTAFEAGVKSRLDGGRLKIDGAIFHYNYDNKQEELRVPDPIFGLLNTLLNVPKSEVRGAELSIAYQPIVGLTLNESATYLDSTVVGDFINYSQFATGPTDTINFKGEQLPNTPKWAFDVGARYDWALGGSHGAYLGGDVRYSSETQSFFGAYVATAAGYPSMVNDSYSLLNLRAGVQSNDGQWRFEAFGENVTNAYYTVASVRLDTVARYTGMPATFGLRMSYRYR
jgi:iron complex outermembrane receptor protein